MLKTSIGSKTKYNNTTDNGSEFCTHKYITKTLKGAVVYFTDSYLHGRKEQLKKQTSS